MNGGPAREGEAQVGADGSADNLPFPLALSMLRDADGDDFQTLLRLYEEALPARERKSAQAVHAMCTSANYRIIVARTQDGIAGFAILLFGASMVLLEYMGVSAATRGRGIGSALYRWVRKSCAPLALPLLTEVDSDRELSPDRDIRTRRKRFYRQLGCRQVVGLDYHMPLAGDEPPPLMDLFVDGCDVTQVPRETVAAWLRDIYRSAYGRKTDDPRLIAMISTLPAEVMLA